MAFNGSQPRNPTVLQNQSSLDSPVKLASAENDLKLVLYAFMSLSTFRMIERIWQTKARNRLEIPDQGRKPRKARQACDVCPFTFCFPSPIQHGQLPNKYGSAADIALDALEPISVGNGFQDEKL
jgi:hypothetical protein